MPGTFSYSLSSFPWKRGGEKGGKEREEGSPKGERKTSQADPYSLAYVLEHREKEKKKGGEGISEKKREEKRAKQRRQLNAYCGELGVNHRKKEKGEKGKRKLRKKKKRRSRRPP